jgi:hypothetical protein
MRLAVDGSKPKLHRPEEQGLNAPRRRRNRDPYAESVRDALLEREEIVGEEIERLFARLEARGEPQGSGVV